MATTKRKVTKRKVTVKKKAATREKKWQITKVCGDSSCRICKSAVELGQHHYFTSRLVQYKNGQVALNAGCRIFHSVTDAKLHWKNNKNPVGDPRPNAPKLIALAQRAAKSVGWDWPLR